MNMKFYSAILLCLVTASLGISQRPPQPRRGDGPPRSDAMRPHAPLPGVPPRDNWVTSLDTNANGILEADEFQAAVDRTFAEFDSNGNGTLDPGEIGPPAGARPAQAEGEGIAPRAGRPGPNDGKHLLPPFFFRGRLERGQAVSKQQFESAAAGVFHEMDTNGDGALQKDEQRPPRPPAGPERPGMAAPPPPNARFIGGEIRFGDKLVKGQPFSAETVVEDTRRLYDGSTVTKQNRGAIYRDTAGRTRREQPLEMVGGFNVVGKNDKPQVLIFINDFPAQTQYFLDLNNNIARKHPIDANAPEPAGPGKRPDAKTESLGTKEIEGIQTIGTRIATEIPAGRLGNDKPIQVVTEQWFSPDLQVMVMSRHVDPLAGEHVFRLVNIKKGEPPADLFSLPQGVRVENEPDRN